MQISADYGEANQVATLSHRVYDE